MMNRRKFLQWTGSAAGGSRSVPVRHCLLGSGPGRQGRSERADCDGLHRPGDTGNRLDAGVPGSQGCSGRRRLRCLGEPAAKGQGHRGPALRQRGLCDLQRLPRGLRPQGHRRRRGGHAGPLARARIAGGGPQRQGHVHGEGAGPGRGLGQGPAGDVSRVRHGLPVGYAAAVRAEFPLRLRAGSQRPDRQAAHDPRRRASRLPRSESTRPAGAGGLGL